MKLEGRILGWSVLAMSLGALAGLGGFTFDYAEGLSYLSEDPRACANCHLMNEQLASWGKGPHRAVADCNDCHVPEDFFGKYLAKGRNGYHHSVGFTFQPSRPDEPGAVRVFEEPIRIKPTNSQILQDNCLRCHGDLVHAILSGSTGDSGAVRCVSCHRGAGHGARH
ncbi:MAG: cytochrome c nitrite reductase small subunit [Deltaproteobacteria bacterium RIFOXYA12_FULL_61_11]|nr:MAG: cytochrome c nitrite reductase small subunit [Deltaproteobacteria bacterium RIFOXYA12_FULL_61_11]